MARVIAHVNQHVVKFNARHGTKLPAVTLKLPAPSQRPSELRNAPGTIYAWTVEGFCTMTGTHAGRAPLSCGARLWLEYDADEFAVSEPGWIGWDILRKTMEAVRDGSYPPLAGEPDNPDADPERALDADKLLAVMGREAASGPVHG